MIVRAQAGEREPPTLRITLPLEGRVHALFDAVSLEDERRLRSWLRRSRAMKALPDLVDRCLDDLDQLDAEAA